MNSVSATTLKSSGRGRPRRFDMEAVLAMGEAMFHELGYADVGIAALTEAFGITPTSFYAAFGSKAAFFEQVVARYGARVLPLDVLLREDAPVADGIAALLEAAARTYAANPKARGCLVLEALRGGSESGEIAGRMAGAKTTVLHDFIAARCPDQADAVTDAVGTTMAGLSACARQGWSAQRLLAVARTATTGIRALLDEG